MYTVYSTYSLTMHCLSLSIIRWWLLCICRELPITYHSGRKQLDIYNHIVNCTLHILQCTLYTLHFTALHTTYCLTRWSSSVDIRPSWCDNSTNLVKSIHFPTVTLLSQMKSQSKRYSVKNNNWNSNVTSICAFYYFAGQFSTVIRKLS